MTAGRIEIDDVQPVVSGGRFPAKAVVGEVVPVTRDGVAGGPRRGLGHPGRPLSRHHLSTAGRRTTGASAPSRTRAHPGGGQPHPRVRPLTTPMLQGRTPDVFHGQFSPDAVGLWTYRVDGWGDPIATWRKNVIAKLEAGQSEGELSNDLLVGARLLERAATGVPRQMRYPVIAAADRLREPGDPFWRAGAALAPEVTELLDQYPLRELITRGEQHGVWVDRAAGEVQFLVRVLPAVHRRLGQRRQRRCTGPSRPRPRRCRGSPGWASTSSTCRPSIRSATCTARAATTASPRRPTTSAHRGRSAATRVVTTRCIPPSGPSTTSTTSSPPPATRASRWPSTWRCSARRIIPWARDHPEWFTVLPDGTIAYAENPPKKYQDIYPLNFDNDPAGIYEEVLRVVRFWMSHGVKIFRVDNPHTKPPELLGVADRRGQEHRPRRPVPGRGLHPARAAVRPCQARASRSPTRTSRGAPPSGRSPSSGSRSPSTPTTRVPTCSSTRPTSCTRACSTAGPACSRSARRWPRR